MRELSWDLLEIVFKFCAIKELGTNVRSKPESDG